MKRAARLLMVPVFVVLLMGADTQSARYEKLGGKIMCSCGCAQMLLKCNHVGCPNSDRMIQQLRANVALPSKSDEDVLNFFRKTWGVTSVVEPSSHGFELIAWVLPAAALGLGLLFVVFMLVRSSRLHPVQVAAGDLNLDPHLESLRARARRETEI